MKTKRNIKSKHRESGANKLVDLLVVLLCLGGAFFGIYMFWQDLNKTLAKLSETPVGIISYKYNAVQRRFSNRFMWSQLQTESPVYNGDIIRTADLSDATITFRDENSIDLAENCLIQIFYDAEGARIELTGGTITANAKSNSLVITSGGRELTLNAGSVVTTNSTETDLDIQVTSGTVTLNSGNLVQTIEAGSGVTVTADVSIEAPPPVLYQLPELLPPPVYPAERTQVSEGSPPEIPAIADNPAVAVNPAPLPLLPAPGNMSPAAGFVIDVTEVRKSRSITFTWNAVAGANAYNFTLYRGSAGGTPVFNARTAGTRYTISDISALDNGNFIWRVEALNVSGTLRRGQNAESRFAVDIPPPSQPVLGVSGTIYGN